jgi:hypothetical protein
MLDTDWTRLLFFLVQQQQQQFRAKTEAEERKVMRIDDDQYR